jgi:murein L,D-transpeptidase YcbB/YkuD
MRPRTFLLPFLLLALSAAKPRPVLSRGASPAQVTPAPLPIRIRALLTDTVVAPARRWPLLGRQPARVFYQPRAYAPAWCNAQQPDARGRAALMLLAQAEDYGLQPRHYHVPALRALADSLALPAAGAAGYRVAQLARFDVLLTDGLMQFALHLRRGQLHAFRPSPLEKAGAPFAPAAWVAHALVAPDFVAALLRCQPPQREYRQLQQALARWRRQPVGPDPLRRQRRAQQLALTLERWRWAAIPDAEYVLVNLPAYQLEVVRGGQVLQTHRVVIGRPANPTPTLSSRLTSFTVAPAWLVPRRVATQQILPYLQANAHISSEHDFLADNNYRLYDAHGRAVNPADVRWEAVTAQNFPYTIRQSSGCGNLLGNIIFPFANPYGLYLNDGPEPKWFDQSYRALGHGSLQLQGPMRLAAYLLGPDAANAHLPTEAQCEAAPQPRSFYLRRPVPLHVRYATCAVVAGQLKFYADVYGQDEVLRRQLFGRR